MPDAIGVRFAVADARQCDVGKRGKGREISGSGSVGKRIPDSGRPERRGRLVEEAVGRRHEERGVAVERTSGGRVGVVRRAVERRQQTQQVLAAQVRATLIGGAVRIRDLHAQVGPPAVDRGEVALVGALAQQRVLEGRIAEVPRLRVRLDVSDIVSDARRQVRVTGQRLALQQEIGNAAVHVLVGAVRQRHRHIVVAVGAQCDVRGERSLNDQRRRVVGRTRIGIGAGGEDVGYRGIRRRLVQPQIGPHRRGAQAVRMARGFQNEGGSHVERQGRRHRVLHGVGRLPDGVPMV